MKMFSSERVKVLIIIVVVFITFVSAVGVMPSTSVEGTSRGADEGKDAHMKLILNLSSQVSEQAEKIAELERELQTKDRDIEQLKLQASSQRQISVHPGEGDNCVNTIGLKQGSKRQRHDLGSRSGVTPVESVSRGNRMSQDTRAVGKLSLQRQSTALSDSDSDWEMDMFVSKIHSAPARTRVKGAATGASDSQHKHSHLNTSNNADTKAESKWSFATDDNEVTLGMGKSPRDYAGLGRQKRRSALKNKQEEERNLRSQRGLIGPTMAFVEPAGDPILDTSCNNTPAGTPRTADSGFHMSTTPLSTFTV
jgi:hypothetical protein